MPDHTLTIRPGHPDFLDLPWHLPLSEWQDPRLIDLPKGISRHEVRFLEYDRGIYVVKEMPLEAARRDYSVLSVLEEVNTLAVVPVGLVENRVPSPQREASAALITEYLEYSFSFRELLEGPGFGIRRNQMLDAFAGLLVELHIAGCFWGDCSLSNVLYRFDAQAVDTIMVDAETAFIVDRLSDGQREEDLQIMIQNVAGGMADIASHQGGELDHADLWLGEDIAKRYHSLWAEIAHVDVISPDERHKIQDRVKHLNELGFEVKEVDLRPTMSGGRLQVEIKPASRNFHARRLRQLTGLDVSEWQAWQLLSDLYYFQGNLCNDQQCHNPIAAIEWRARVFEPMVERLRGIEGISNPIQAFCDVLHHRYVKSIDADRDIGTEAALTDWLVNGRPGYKLDQASG
ncbi:MAG: DUF4032 domain-containing protein [Proteobacteria bacterium]|nr:DUF4032 domain-containing protein [Pseudomonadota bacterium]